MLRVARLRRCSRFAVASLLTTEVEKSQRIKLYGLDLSTTLEVTLTSLNNSFDKKL